MDGVQTMLTGIHERSSYYTVIMSLKCSMLLPTQLSDSKVPHIEEVGGNA